MGKCGTGDNSLTSYSQRLMDFLLVFLEMAKVGDWRGMVGGNAEIGKVWLLVYICVIFYCFKELL